MGRTGSVLVNSYKQGSDWADYVPVISNFGTTTLGFAKWKQVGDSIFVRFSFTTGTGTASIGTLSVPASISIDATNSEVGRSASSDTTNFDLITWANGAGTVSFVNAGAAVNTLLNGSSFASGKVIYGSFHARVPAWATT